MKPIAEHELAAADARLKAAQQPWFEGMDADERQALIDYKGAAGRAMNRFLRGEGERPGVAKSASDLRRALHRAAAPDDMLLYRGAGAAEADTYRAMAPGGTTRVPTFLSTSLACHIASDTARVQGGVVVELLVRKGQKGVAYVHPFPTYRYKQYEVLVNAGSVLKMLRADGGAIRLEVCDDDGNE